MPSEERKQICDMSVSVVAVEAVDPGASGAAVAGPRARSDARPGVGAAAVHFGGAASRDDDAARHGRAIAGETPRSAKCRIGHVGSRRWVLVGLVLLVVAAGAVFGARYLPDVYAWLSNPDAVHAFVDEHAVLSRLALLAINTLQIVVAVLPGEPVELASGYAFGFWEGTALCLAASAIGSTVVFWAVRRWGREVVGLFFKEEQIERFEWMRNARRLELIMLIVFLIPGTPKDVLTYVAGLTTMRFGALLAIATLGRIPSIVTSTVAAAAFGAGQYGVMVVSIVLAGILVVAGAWIYKKVEARHQTE